MKELSNWGRWGGTISWARRTCSPRRSEEPRRLCQDRDGGIARPRCHHGEGAATRPSRYVLKMTVNPDRQNATDRFDIDYHGGTFSHLDALCHVAYKGRGY